MLESVESIAFVTFACRRDVNYAKALLGSIAHFYPINPIHVVLEADVKIADREQLARFPNVTVHRVQDLIAQHKLSLTRLLAKLNVLFLPGVKRALVADADSVLVDMVLDRVPDRALFVAFRSHQVKADDPSSMKAFSDWAIDLEQARRLGWRFRDGPMTYVGGSHFFVDVSRFPRHLVVDLLPHMGFGHDTVTPLRAGDQGFWTYFANVYQAAPREELHFMDVSPDATVQQSVKFPQARDLGWVQSRCGKEVSFVHYIGFSRRFRRRDHEFSEVLCWATRKYYEALGSPREFVRDEIRRVCFASAGAAARLARMTLRRG